MPRLPSWFVSTGWALTIKSGLKATPVEFPAHTHAVPVSHSCLAHSLPLPPCFLLRATMSPFHPAPCVSDLRSSPYNVTPCCFFMPFLVACLLTSSFSLVLVCLLLPAALAIIVLFPCPVLYFSILFLVYSPCHGPHSRSCRTQPGTVPPHQPFFLLMWKLLLHVLHHCPPLFTCWMLACRRSPPSLTREMTRGGLAKSTENSLPASGEAC